jgi:glutathione S-transferase
LSINSYLLQADHQNSRLEQSRSHRILWLLEELKLPYELKTYRRQKTKLADPKLKEIHPLGKSPILEIEIPGAAKPIVLIESAAIVEYLVDHYGQWLVPKRYQEGKDGQIGGETESWLRYRTYMHYAEGSMMPLSIIGLLVSGMDPLFPHRIVQPTDWGHWSGDTVIKKAPVPFFLRPITNGVASRIETSFLTEQFNLHYNFLEEQLSTSPDGGEYLCGKDLTAADILMSFAIEAGNRSSGFKQDQYPKVFAYLEKLHEHAGYKRATEKVIEAEGEFKALMWDLESTFLARQCRLMECEKLLVDTSRNWSRNYKIF